MGQLSIIFIDQWVFKNSLIEIRKVKSKQNWKENFLYKLTSWLAIKEFLASFLLTSGKRKKNNTLLPFMNTSERCSRTKEQLSTLQDAIWLLRLRNKLFSLFCARKEVGTCTSKLRNVNKSNIEHAAIIIYQEKKGKH